MSVDPEKTRRTVIRLSSNLWPFSVESEWVREQTQEIREQFTPERRQQLLDAIHQGGGNADTLRAQAELQYWLTFMQVNSSERGERQLARGTWVLAVATIGLLIATVVLVVVTATHHGG